MKAVSRSRSRVLCVVSFAVLSLSAVHGWASASEDAEDIRDKPIDKVQSKLANRGYAQLGPGSQQQYWWNRSKEQCLEVHLKNNKVSHAEVVDEKKCREADKRAPSHAGAAPAAHGSSSLVGMRASNLDAEMARRGFSNKGGYKDQDTSYTTWWNKSTRECVSVATRDGRVDNMRAVSEGNCR